jgi:hypothetical protein
MFEALAKDVKDVKGMVDEMHTCLKIHIAQCEARGKMVEEHQVTLHGPPGDTEGVGGLVGHQRIFSRTAAVAWTGASAAVGTLFVMAVDYVRNLIGIR